MAIERKCENCFFKDFYGDKETWTCRHCISNGINNDYDINCKHDFFKPAEKAIRQDEREKIINFIEKDNKKFNAIFNRQRYANIEFMRNNKQAIKDYIHLLVWKLKKEK